MEKRNNRKEGERKILWTTANTHCFIFRISSSSISFAPFAVTGLFRPLVRSLGDLAMVR